MKKNTLFVVRAGVIAAAYAAISYVSAAVGLAYGAVQFRFSEILTVLPVFTPAAVPGLVVGCIFANLFSPLGIADVVFGSAATLAAAVFTRLLRKYTIRSVPVLSLLPPVVFNAFIVAAEIALLASEDAGAAVFWYNVLTVGIGEGVVCFAGGIPLFLMLRRTGVFQKTEFRS